MLNVTTVSTIGKFLKTGIPLTHKRLTVAGDAILHPKNLEVPIGLSPVEIRKAYYDLDPERLDRLMADLCIGCGKCVRDCPVGAMTVRGNVARVDYTKCVGCGKCAASCPVGAIQIPEKYQPQTI